MWSFTNKGLLDLRSYKRTCERKRINQPMNIEKSPTCPVEVPTPKLSPFLCVIAVTAAT